MTDTTRKGTIALVGFMGCGKTAVGRELAARLSMGFVDLDEQIQRREGRTVQRIFAEDGEKHFRDCERAALLDLGADDAVVAVGGGAYASDEAVALLNSRATVLWLDCPVELCLRRCRAGTTARPLCSDRENFFDLHRQRLRFYRRAHLRVDASAASPQEVASRAMAALGFSRR